MRELKCFLCLLLLIPSFGFAVEGVVIEEITNGNGDYLFKHSLIVDSTISENVVNLDYNDRSLFMKVKSTDSLVRENGFDYKLEGFSPQWFHSKSENTVLNYANLKGGEYTLIFKIRGDSVSRYYELPVIVATPFWTTVWFYLLLVVVLGICGFFVYTSRINRISKLKHVLEKQVSNRTKDLEEKTSEINEQKEKIFEQRNLANKQTAKIAEQKEELERQRGELQRLVREQSNDLALVKKQVAEKSKEIIASESKYQLLAENSRDMIFRLKLPEDVMEFVSPASVNLTGYDPDEFYQNSGLYRKMIAKESRESFIDMRRRLLSGETIPTFDYKLTKKDGTEKWVSQRNVVIKGRNGEIEALEAIVFDISEQKKDEVAMKAAWVRAKETDKLKTAFLSSMSHEIRTPMNSIVGFADLLEDESISPSDRRQYVKQINDSSVALLQLIDDIVDVTKMEAGELNVLHAPLDVEQLVLKVGSEFESELNESEKSANVSFSVDIDSAVKGLIMNSDKARLEQVLRNLISNGIKYTEEGFVRVRVELDSDTSSKVNFIIEDSGIGIPAERQTEIFDRYRYVRGNGLKKSNGSGLGLAISRSLVELLGGELTLQSERGNGSTFAFTLKVDSTSTKSVAKKETQAEQSVVNWSDKHILVAEDEDNNFKFMQAALKKTNVILIRARDGQEAIEVFKEKQHLIDLVLMDIQMPKMNGYDATKALLKIDEELPVIAQTAFAMSGGKIKCFDAGCIGYISKPYKAKELISVISKHIR